MEHYTKRKLLSLSKLHQKRHALRARPALKFGISNRPPIESLENKLQIILDQQQSSACTGFSYSACLRLQNFSLKDPSALWLYSQERILEQGTSRNFLSDVGASPSDCLTVLLQIGTVSDKDYPFSMQNVTKIPSPSLLSLSRQHKVSSAYSINPTDLETLKQSIIRGIPISVGIILYDSFMNYETSQTGEGKMPGLKDRIVGGHEVTLIGYNDLTNQFLLLNSWGPGWGRKNGFTKWSGGGLFTLPYSYFTSLSLVMFAGIVIP